MSDRVSKKVWWIKLNRRKYISISEVISLLYTLISARAKTHTKFNVHHRYRALRAKRMLTDSRVHAHSHKRACTHIHTSAVFAHVHCCALTHNIQAWGERSLSMNCLFKLLLTLTSAHKHAHTYQFSLALMLTMASARADGQARNYSMQGLRNQGIPWLNL